MAIDAKPPPVSTADRPRGSRWNYALLAAIGAMPVLAALADAPLAITAASVAPALVALQWLVWRRGGWRLIGPHSYYDLVRMSRKGRTGVLRSLFLIALLAAIWRVYDTWMRDRHLGDAVGIDPDAVVSDRAAAIRDAQARFNTRCVENWLLLQNF